MNFSDNPKQLREMIRILERKLGIFEESEFSCCGITFSQCHALIEIGRAKNISLNELAELLNLENSTMSRTVNNLVTSDLAKRDI
ncbi:MAG: helix-turn-helix domain-containing protein, partial [Bacillota bacterium]|nr:helix-turn-helix domain-containing protein [Bacillota bacterium]